MDNDDLTIQEHRAHQAPVRRLPRMTRRAVAILVTLALAVGVGFAFWSSRPVPDATPGGDFVAWVGTRAVAMSATSCTALNGCDTESLSVTAGEKVRIGFRSGSPLSMTTDPSAGVFAALDGDGWYLDTAELRTPVLVGVVGGDGSLWQFGLSPATR